MPGTAGENSFVGLPVDLFSQVQGRPPVPPCVSVTWSATLGGTPVLTDGTNCILQQIFGLPGAAVVTTSFSDILGTASASRTINIVDDGLPHIKITFPVRDGIEGRLPVANATDGDILPLSVVSTPPGTPYDYTWTVSAVGEATYSFVTPLTNTSTAPNYDLRSCSHTRATITVAITDSLGHMAHDSIPVTVFSDHCDPP